MQELLCFETEALQQRFRAAYPDADHSLWMTADELVAQLLERPPGDEPGRVSEFTRLLPEEDRADAARWYQSLRLLRRSLVLSHDDADFAFSALPETPRNRRLRSLLHRYLDSPLLDDETTRYWTVIEALKEFRLDAPAARLTFVKALESSPLFSELATAFRASPSAQTVSLLESWEWKAHDATERARPLVVLSAPVASLLERLGGQAARAWQRGQSARVFFAGSPRERFFLTGYLAHRRVPYRELWEKPAALPATPEPFRDLLSALRGDNSRELKTRLKLLALLTADERNHRRLGTRDSVLAYLPRFAQLKRLSPDELQYLQGLAQSPPTFVAPPATAEKGVLLLPFHPLPFESGSLSLVFAGRETLAASETGSLLTESEAEALHRAGFPHPRASETRARRLQALQALRDQAPGRRHLYQALAEGTLPFRARHWHLRRAPAPPAAEPRESFPDLPERALSATQLEAYAACPAAYFFSYRLRMRRFQSGEDAYALLFGQAVHSALERFFKTTPRDSIDLRKHFSDALLELAPSLENDLPLVTTLHAHFARLARRLPEVESQLARVEGAATPTLFERPFELALENVRIVGKIDRVDRRADGSWVVLDYKTGTVDFTPDHVARGLNFQALIYLLAAESLGEAPCAGVVFYDLKKGEVRRGMLREDLLGGDAKKALTRGHVMALDKFEKLKAEGTTHLRKLAAAISQGEFPAIPNAENCGRCDYALYCRRSAAHG